MAAPLLSLKSARLAPAGETLIDGLDCDIGAGDRICLVGRNGSGKSTLLRALAGEIELDGGERHADRRTAIGYLPQTPVLPAATALTDYVVAGLPGHLRTEDAPPRAERLLATLGLSPAQTTDGLSGGEQRRLSLARTLILAPEILLLDEPTNHLDLPTIEWLESELLAFRGAIVMISHDRRVLSTLSRTTWWLDRGRMRINPEGFAAFEDWSNAVLEAEANELARLDKHLEAEERWLHRGVTARRKRNQGRLRKLADLRNRRATWQHQQGGAKLEAASTGSGGTLVIEAKSISKNFDGRPIVDSFSTRIRKGDRIGLVGANGSGKTTLLNLLIGELPPDSGEIRLGTNLALASFDQNRQQLDLAKTPWQILCPDGGDRLDVNGHNRHVIGYLRDFLFTEAQARTPVSTFSGGERSRLLLARILASPSNLLVLDEPTNDLDIETLDLLEETLADYAGTLLLVSHDRDFLDRLVTATIALEGNGRVVEYAGGYSDMIRVRDAKVAASTAPGRKSKASEGRLQHKARRDHQKLMRELDRLPEKIDSLSVRMQQVEKDLADPDLYSGNNDRFKKLEEERQDLARRRAELEERWLELELLSEEAQDV